MLSERDLIDIIEKIAKGEVQISEALEQVATHSAANDNSLLELCKALTENVHELTTRVERLERRATRQEN